MKPSIRAIIFDLGGVVLNIDFSKTQQALEKLGLRNAYLHFGQYAQLGFFDELDKGNINKQQLFDQLNALLPEPVSNDKLSDAWNAMILDFPVEVIQLLQNLRKKYILGLLSNTNAIHYELYNKNFRILTKHNLDDYFDYACYSFRVGMRKPNPDIFYHVLEKLNIQPLETLFIDDTITHINAAKEIGFLTHHLLPGETITDLFDDEMNIKIPLTIT